MTTHNSFAPGKIILSGEYGALFGRAGIAVPSTIGITAAFDGGSANSGIEIRWGVAPSLLSYAHKIVELCQQEKTSIQGKLTIHSTLPLGKGMGSSTALIVAVVRALLGDARETALRIENELSPGNSGFDFAVIWQGVPILYKKGTVRPFELSTEVLQGAILIDTGVPGESTNELVAWMRSRESEIGGLVDVIGRCTERLIQGESLRTVMRDHHKAQVELGVVPPDIQEFVAVIEFTGGAAKVIGAGSRTGGAGMMLALGNQKEIESLASQRGMSTILI